MSIVFVNIEHCIMWVIPRKLNDHNGFFFVDRIITEIFTNVLLIVMRGIRKEILRKFTAYYKT